MKTTKADRPSGFTLVELLVTTTIIGLLAVAGSASYSFVRSKARDARRVSDIRTISNAIELYFEQNQKYPTSPPEGVVIGSDAGKMISDAGITPFGGEAGLLYLQNAPFNVLPGGAPYLYHSRNRDGSVCTKDCPSFEVTFGLEYPTGDLDAGPHLLTDEGVMGSEAGTSGVSELSPFAQYAPTAQDIAAAFGSVRENAELARELADREDVQTANAAIVAPVSVIGVSAGLLATLATALPLANAGQFVLLLIAQPFLAFTRRKRQGWGTVYNAATKVPIDLAIVRLIDARANRIVATKVTDKDGRFAFSPKAGTYRLEAVKPGFTFPSESLATVQDDGVFGEIYHGTLIETVEDGKTLTISVPMDTDKEPAAEVRQLLTERNKKSLRKAAAVSGPLIAAVALIVSPGVPMLLLFLLQLFLYQVFRRVAEPAAPAAQGTIFDLDTRKPISGAVVRVLSLPYHKVLETRLTGSQGRYSFQVGAGMYYVTVVKPGYEKTETDPIDFTQIVKPAWIASDLPMRRHEEKDANAT